MKAIDNKELILALEELEKEGITIKNIASKKAFELFEKTKKGVAIFFF